MLLCAMLFRANDQQYVAMNAKLRNKYEKMALSALKKYIYFLLWNKIARIIVQLADMLHISTDRALQIFYDSGVCRMLHDKYLGLHLMSDTYIVKDLIEELRKKQ